jgi:hypothetical protein
MRPGEISASRITAAHGADAEDVSPEHLRSIFAVDPPVRPRAAGTKRGGATDSAGGGKSDSQDDDVGSLHLGERPKLFSWRRLDRRLV